jgi:hypothetical protein
LGTTAASDNGAEMTSIHGWFPSPWDVELPALLPIVPKGPGSSRIVDVIPSVPRSWPAADGSHMKTEEGTQCRSLNQTAIAAIKLI